jgi:release factor glutamine methyltransferase
VSATIQELLLHDTAALKAALSLDAREARSEVQCLLQATLQQSRAYLLAHPEYELSQSEWSGYLALLHRRLAGEPIAYILDEREFFGLQFKVTPATLIPRPETELLVEMALQRISQQPGLRILDMGTGSGAIALAIAHARPDAEVWACDSSSEALAIADENARRLEIQNVRFIESDWFSAFDGQHFDMIVSNPPYVSADDVHLTQGDVRFEPISALASGGDGLNDIRKIIYGAGVHLQHEGFLFLEHGYEQAGKVRSLLIEADFEDVHTVIDLAGIERVTGGRWRTKRQETLPVFP